MARDVKSVCPYCGVGCGLIVSTDGQKVLSVKGDPKHPANFGKLCPKGATLAQTVDVTTRLRYASVRGPAGKMDRVSPADAITHVSSELSRIIAAHGPESVAFYLSGQMTTEAQYVAAKFAKACLRTNHCDSNSRLCMSAAAGAMNLSLGSDGPPAGYADIELADAFLFVGSNAADCHPITFTRIKQRIEKSGAKCIVVDPRKTATADVAQVHLPLRPGTDLALLNGFLHLLAVWGKIDRAYIDAHTEGWAELEAMLPEYSPTRVSDICGIDREQFIAAAKIIADTPKLITFWTMGVNQTVQGTFTGNAIINLHLVTGRIGKPGAGPFSLTGQPNAMGGRDVGYMSHQLPGQRLVANPEHRAQMEKFWGLSEGHLGPHPGYDAVRIFEAAAAEEIKALWIIGTNPAASMPNLPAVRAGIEKLELCIVQDAYFPTETTKFAHVLLPAAINLEQAGTFTNSERRVSLMEPAATPPGDAKPDWWWVQQVAGAMGFSRGMSYTSAAGIFDEFARSTAGRPNDQSALYHPLLKDRGPQQWPYAAMGKPASRRYEDARFPTPSGKARLFARQWMEMEDAPGKTFPLLLTTGRVLNQWHTRTKTGQVPALNKLDPCPYLQMHPEDAERLKLHAGQQIVVASRFGVASTFLTINKEITPGVVFMPIHWNELWGHRASCNEATSDLRDPISKQPSLKAVAVKVTAVGDAKSQGGEITDQSKETHPQSDEATAAISVES